MSTRRRSFSSSPLHGLLAIGIGLGLSGCSTVSTDQNGGDGEETVPNGGQVPNDPQSPPDNPAQPAPGPDQPAHLGCPGNVILHASCNYVTTREQNLAAGFTPVQPGEDLSQRTIFDLYQPTDACKKDLAEWFHLDDATWKKPENKKARDAALSGLHTLFFHPALLPADGSFYWKGGTQKVESTAMGQYGLPNVPADELFVMKRNMSNNPLMESFYARIGKITLAPSLEGAAPMKTVAGVVDVSAAWLTAVEDPNDSLDFVRRKYAVASTFFAEMEQANGLPEHTTCAKHFGAETSCDAALLATSYGRQAQLELAFSLGIAYARAPNDNAMLASEAHYKKNWTSSCERATEKVNALGAWVKANDPTRVACSAAAASEPLVARRANGSTVPPVNEDAGEDYACF